MRNCRRKQCGIMLWLDRPSLPTAQPGCVESGLLCVSPSTHCYFRGKSGTVILEWSLVPMPQREQEGDGGLPGCSCCISFNTLTCFCQCNVDEKVLLPARLMFMSVRTRFCMPCVMPACISRHTFFFFFFFCSGSRRGFISVSLRYVVCSL